MLSAVDFSLKLKKIIDHYKELSEKLNFPDNLSQKDFRDLSRERSNMEEIVELGQEYLHKSQVLEDLISMGNDSSNDKEIRDMAMDEAREMKKYLSDELYQKIKILLLPKDEDDEKNVILEIRAGAGGEEASLFANTLFEMYRKYAALRGWKFEPLSISETGVGGYKEVSATITGNAVFARLKFESGVHRVQRVPKTESSGRVHTSTVTVAVLPEAEEVDVQINENDLRIDVYRASGAGGQHVNTTDSAVRITHMPSGIVVSQQSQRSQWQNKAAAMKTLRALLYEAERNKKHESRAAMRKGQIGTGDRSERIRTYNFSQNRVTDHRINITAHSIDAVLEGEIDLFVDGLIAEDQAANLAASDSELGC
jgi:peptide chain release factor 1